MLSREIGVSSNLVSYGKEKPARFLETVTLCEAFRGNFQKNRLQSLLSYDISAYLFLCLHLFNISVRLFSILLFLCNAIFSFSFKNSEHLLLLVLYAWCLPKISHVMFALHLLSFILQKHFIPSKHYPSRQEFRNQSLLWYLRNNI